MLGAICGDIVGSIYEGSPIKTKDFKLFTEEKFFTDDTVMTVAIADALLSLNEYTENKVKESIIKKMKEYGKKYENVGYGGMFRRWLFLEDEGKSPYNSCGNGSAMRVSTVGWLFDSLEKTREMARWTAEVTHNHPEGIKGAEATATVIYLARTGYTKKEIQKYIKKEFYPLEETLDEIRQTYKFNATCQGTVPQAIQAFLEGISFEDVIRNAISLGGDSDTLTCIAGSMAEACYEIPEDIKQSILSYLCENLKNVIIDWYDYKKVSNIVYKPNPKDLEMIFNPSVQTETVNNADENKMQDVCQSSPINDISFLSFLKHIFSNFKHKRIDKNKKE